MNKNQNNDKNGLDVDAIEDAVGDTSRNEVTTVKGKGFTIEELREFIKSKGPMGRQKEKDYKDNGAILKL